MGIFSGWSRGISNFKRGAVRIPASFILNKWTTTKPEITDLVEGGKKVVTIVESHNEKLIPGNMYTVKLSAQLEGEEEPTYKFEPFKEQSNANRKKSNILQGGKRNRTRKVRRNRTRKARRCNRKRSSRR